MRNDNKTIENSLPPEPQPFYSIIMKIVTGLYIGMAAIGLMMSGAGCETERADQVRIDVEPREATLMPGESVDLRAYGWHSYHWALGDTRLGYLSARTGDRTTYTSITTNDAIQIITVSIDRVGTNQWDVAASAIITHEAEELPESTSVTNGPAAGAAP